MTQHAIRAVFRRDLRGWFGNPTGYVFILLFVGLAAAALVGPIDFFRNNLANLDTLNFWFPLLATVFVSAITMGMWSTERTQGTQELLFTLPAKDGHILIGKYLAAAGVFTVSLLFMLTLPIGLSMLGTPDWGQMFSNFLGFWLLGIMLVSVAMLGSQFSDSLAVAFLLGALFCGTVLYAGWGLKQVFPAIGASWETDGPMGQFADFARGLVTPAGLIMFVGLTVAFLYCNLMLLSRRHWRLGEANGLHRIFRFLAMAVITVALTMLAVDHLPRMDSTVERIFSLSGETHALLAKLDAKKPVFVTAYVSDDVPQEYVQTRRNLLNLLDQYDAMGGGAVQVRIVPTEAFSKAAEEAEKNYAIHPRPVMSQQGANVTEMGVYLGLAFTCSTEEVVIPFVDLATPIEYEMTRSIRTVANANRRKVGVLKTDVELNGGFDFQTFEQKTKWEVVDELKLQYQVEVVEPDKDYPADLDAMIVPQPSSLAQEQMDRLKTWLEDGHPALLIEDPQPLDAPNTSATDQKGGGRRNPMMGGAPPPGQKGDIDSLLSSFGVQFNKHDLVWDNSYRAYPAFRLPPEFVIIDRPGFNAQDAATRGLQRCVLLMTGYLRPQDRDGLTVTPLMRSVAPVSGTIPKLNVFQFNPFGGPPIPDGRRRHTPRTQEYVVAARVTGKPKEGKTKGVNLVVMADLDMIGNQFFAIRDRSPDPTLRFDNVTFVLNCIDHLVGDQSLIDLRSRRPRLRTLERVEEAEKVFEERWMAQREQAEERAKKELDDAQGRLNAAVAKVTNDKELDESSKEMVVEQIRQKEQRMLDLRQKEIERDKRKELEAASYARTSSKRAVQAGYKGWTILLTPLPALLVGCLMFFRRRAREASIVPGKRLVTGVQS